MIHTIQLYTILSLGDIKYIEELYKSDIKDIIKKIQDNYEGVVINFFTSNLNQTYFISLFIDAIKLLGRAEIKDIDSTCIQQTIDDISDALQLPDESIFTLTRIDYRLDIVVKDKIQREFMFNLYNKLFKKYGFLKMNNKKKIITPMHVKTTEKFKTTLYFSSRSVTVAVYDKEKEREAKKEMVQAHEKDVLRFELRLNNKHLQYKKSKGIPKRLSSYMNNAVYESYMQQYLYSIFGKDDYYSLRAIRKIMKDKGIKDKDKQEIEAFLKDVSKSGLEKTKENYSLYKRKKILKKLKELKINPIPIPINAHMPATIRNPLR